MTNIKILLIIGLFLAFGVALHAQTESTNTNGYAKWRLGLDAGLNFNMTGLGYQDLEPEGAVYYDEVTNDGIGFGPRVGLFGEYLSGDWWGIILRATYDSRSVVSQDETNEPFSEYDITADYFSIEPMLRIDQPWIPYLNFRVGPTLQFKMNAEYDYKPDKDGETTMTGVEMPLARDITMGATAGLSYDIMLNDPISKHRWFLSPYLDINWLMSQKDLGNKFYENLHDNIDDTWSTVTLSLGVKASVEFVSDRELASFITFNNLVLTLPADGVVRVREVEDFFPLVQHVFFDAGSQEIPERYISLTPQQAQGFDEEMLHDLTERPELANKPKFDKQLYVYHNIQNIFGYRMREESNEDVLLIGSAPKEGDGEVLAQKVKDYLVNNFGIEADRISIRGQEMPRVPSGTASTPQADRPLADIENRRVEFVFSNQDMYKPIQIRMLDEASLENDLIFAINPGVRYDSWNVMMSGEGKSITYGPFYSSVERINPVELVRDLDEGTFTARVVINAQGGSSVEEESKFKLIKEIDKVNLGARYTVLFEYAQTDPITANEALFREYIAPEIKEGYRGIIHGHTDNIGSDQVNRKLSFDRATEAKTVLDDELANLGRTVDIEAFGFGEQKMPSSFPNTLPEGRFYNRNVTIEVIPLID